MPAGCPLLIVEGCGAARLDLTPWIDVVVWVQSDTNRARTRSVLRDGGTAEAEAFWDEWLAEELPFFAQDRPWERADSLVSGMPELSCMPELSSEPAFQVVVSARA